MCNSKSREVLLSVFKEYQQTSDDYSNKVLYHDAHVVRFLYLYVLYYRQFRQRNLDN